MIAHRIRTFLISLVAKERSSNQLAISFCIGTYIAFSPFIGFHTILTFLVAWLLRLNVAVTFSASLLFHNPWTTVPIYGLDYVFGEWLLKTFGGIDTLSLNPPFMASFNETLSYYVGLPKIAFWSFMIGGNVLGIAISLLLYPIMKRVFSKLVAEIHGIA